MKRLCVLFAVSISVLAIAYQQSLPRLLSGHVEKLLAAESLVATVKVTDLTGTTEDLTIEFSKPNYLKIEGSASLIISDGKTLTVLDKQANIYTQTPVGDVSVLQQATGVSAWGWTWFFQKDSTKVVKSAAPGQPRTMRGLAVTEASAVLLDGRTTATFYIENKTGIAKGFTLKNSEKTVIVWAESLVLSDKPLDTKPFTFVAPEGAKTVAEVVPATGTGNVSWIAVSRIFNAKCMPCHSAARRSAGINLTTYATATKIRHIVSGSSEDSLLVRAIRGGGTMPLGRPRLSEPEVQIIVDWIDGGLKP